MAKLDTGIWAQAMTVSIVRLRCLVRRGGAVHMPIQERLEREETIAKLDAGIARVAALRCGSEVGVTADAVVLGGFDDFDIGEVRNERAIEAVCDLSNICPMRG